MTMLGRRSLPRPLAKSKLLVVRYETSDVSESASALCRSRFIAPSDESSDEFDKRREVLLGLVTESSFLYELRCLN